LGLEGIREVGFEVRIEMIGVDLHHLQVRIGNALSRG